LDFPHKSVKSHKKSCKSRQLGHIRSETAKMGELFAEERTSM